MSPRWDTAFLAVAKTFSLLSKDPSTKVGAVLVRDRKIISTGFNGFPPGIEDSPERLNDRDAKLDLIQHAEMNAILHCPVDTQGADLYVTFQPCKRCSLGIISAGIRRVCWIDTEIPERWIDSMKTSEDILAEAGVVRSCVAESDVDRWIVASLDEKVS